MTADKDADDWQYNRVLLSHSFSYILKLEDTRSIIDTLVNAGRIYVPDTYGDEIGGPKFTTESIPTILREWSENQDRYRNISFYRKKPMEVAFSLDQERNFEIDGLLLTVERRCFESGREIDEFLDLSKKLYHTVHSFYGRIECGPFNGRIAVINGIIPPQWGTFYGPEHAKFVNLDKIREAGVYRCEILDDGGVLIVLTPHPGDMADNTPEYQMKMKAALEAIDNRLYTTGLKPQLRFSEERKKMTEEYQKRKKKEEEEARKKRTDPKYIGLLEEWLTNYEGFAQSFVEMAKGWGLKLDFSGEGLKHVDEYFQHKRDFKKKLSNGEFSVLWFSLAAYLAVVIKRKFGGEPTLDRNEGRVIFGPIPGSSVKFYPTEYILKYFENPEEKALHAFHRALKVMVERGE